MVSIIGSTTQTANSPNEMYIYWSHTNNQNLDKQVPKSYWHKIISLYTAVQWMRLVTSMSKENLTE